MKDWVPAIVAALSFFLNGFVALILWGRRGDIETLKADNRALMAESVLQLFHQINGSYVRIALHKEMSARIDRLEDRIRALEEEQ